MTKRHNRDEQQYHIAQWRNSGLSQRVYCERNGLSWTAFKNWSKRVKPVIPNAQFAPIHITPLTDSQWIIEAADGLRVRVPAHSDERSLLTLIKVLRSGHAA